MQVDLQAWEKSARHIVNNGSYNDSTVDQQAAHVLYLIAALRKTTDELDQARVQLAGCLTVAEGHGLNDPAKRGDYGWSMSYEQVLDLRRKYNDLRARFDKLEQVVNGNVAGDQQ